MAVVEIQGMNKRRKTMDFKAFVRYFVFDRPFLLNCILVCAFAVF